MGADDRPPRRGAPVEVFPCGTDLNANDRRRDQLWRVDSAGSGYVRIRNFISPNNYCLGVVGVDSPGAGPLDFSLRLLTSCPIWRYLGSTLNL